MYRNVLLPVDGSALAEVALPWALAAAGPAGTVHLVHVHILPVPASVEGMIVTTPSEDEILRESEADYLHDLTGRIRTAAPGMTVTSRNIDPEGPFAEVLSEVAVDSSADLIVTTTHGRGPFTRFLLGSIADGLVRNSPVPVLVLRPEESAAPIDLAARPQLKHLIIPLDGSELAEQIVAPAVRLGRVFGADYTLLLVLDPQASSITTPPEADAYLGGVARSISEQNGGTRTRVIENGSPARAIQEQAGRDPATGVALATHGRSGLTRLLKGSVADEIIRKSSGPVLTLHPYAR